MEILPSGSLIDAPIGALDGAWKSTAGESARSWMLRSRRDRSSLSVSLGMCRRPLGQNWPLRDGGGRFAIVDVRLIQDS